MTPSTTTTPAAPTPVSIATQTPAQASTPAASATGNAPAPPATASQSGSANTPAAPNFAQAAAAQGIPAPASASNANAAAATTTASGASSATAAAPSASTALHVSDTAQSLGQFAEVVAHQTRQVTQNSPGPATTANAASPSPANTTATAPTNTASTAAPSAPTSTSTSALASAPGSASPAAHTTAPSAIVAPNLQLSSAAQQLDHFAHIVARQAQSLPSASASTPSSQTSPSSPAPATTAQPLTPAPVTASPSASNAPSTSTASPTANTPASQTSPSSPTSGTPATAMPQSPAPTASPNTASAPTTPTSTASGTAAPASPAPTPSADTTQNASPTASASSPTVNPAPSASASASTPSSQTSPSSPAPATTAQPLTPAPVTPTTPATASPSATQPALTLPASPVSASPSANAQATSAAGPVASPLTAPSNPAPAPSQNTPATTGSTTSPPAPSASLNTASAPTAPAATASPAAAPSTTPAPKLARAAAAPAPSGPPAPSAAPSAASGPFAHLSAQERQQLEHLAAQAAQRIRASAGATSHAEASARPGPASAAAPISLNLPPGIQLSPAAAQALRSEAFAQLVAQQTQRLTTAAAQANSPSANAAQAALWPAAGISRPMTEWLQRLLRHLTTTPAASQRLISAQHWSASLTPILTSLPGPPTNAPEHPTAPEDEAPSDDDTDIAPVQRRLGADARSRARQRTAALARLTAPSSSAGSAANSSRIPALQTWLTHHGSITGSDGSRSLQLSLQVPAAWARAMHRLGQSAPTHSPGPLPPLTFNGSIQHLPTQFTLALALSGQAQPGTNAALAAQIAQLRTSALLHIQMQPSATDNAATQTAAHWHAPEPLQHALHNAQHSADTTPSASQDPWLLLAQHLAEHPPHPGTDTPGLCTTTGCQYQGRAPCAQPFCPQINHLAALNAPQRKG